MLKYWKIWEPHRKKVIEIISNSKIKNDKTIAFFGAGFCNDIDISFFQKNYSNVTLIDQYGIALEKGIKNQGIDKNSIELKELNFFEVNKSLISEFNIALKSKKKTEELIEILLLLRESIELNPLVKYLKYDYTVSIAVHSQLCNDLLIPLTTYKVNYSNEEIKKIKKMLETVYYKYITLYNKLLIESSKRGTYIILDSKMLLNKCNKTNLEKFSHSIFGYGLCQQNIHNITTIRNYKLNKNTWIWKYSDYRDYEVNSFFIEK
ncbi:hypothetical protein [Clostridium perfringens]|uniref:hypothetical protein n=1 Tax=Clostridium perfringens TaxID=1502 RepID=UPI0018E406D1|nr:hypothetical protein [Clostridium perfringens]MBI6039881.1 hypothetical protein [Clostridium perfringens]